MVNYPMDWEMITLGEIIKEGFGNLVKPSFKIKKYDYKHFGSTPIISQEKEFISGYCNLSDINILSDQYICFGDHTEIFKYIDFSFIQGADGLKILKFNEEKIITKYAYYSLLFFYQRQNNYGRHFNHLLETQIAFPSLPEQRLIAETLSQFDTYISDLDELIVKKRNIRDGALEDLVSGKTRLQDFKGEWIKDKLIKHVTLIQGLTYKPEDIVSSGILVLRSSNIQNKQLSFNDKVFVKTNVPYEKMIQHGDILICVRNGSVGLIGKSCIMPKLNNTTFGAFMSVLRGDKTGYIAKVFESTFVQNQLRNRTSATINQITKKDFESLIIPWPSESEQQAIADVLTSMDNEIESLEMERDKMIQIREGAMDELLTGRVRLTK